MRGWLLLRLLPLLFGHGLAAPRTDSRSGQPDAINITNPFTPGEEHLSILHGYLQEKDPLGKNDTNMTRETAILHLFLLHDYDKSGLLDGLELMQLLYGILTKDLQEKPTEDAVISIVDEVLETQDINLDGLLCAQELVNSVSYKDKESMAPAHIVIPPPMGVPVEEPPAPVDNDLSDKENTDQPEMHHQQAQDNVPSDHIDEPAIPLAETVSSQEEPDEDHNEDVVEEVISDVEAVEMPGEEEEDKPDDEM
ncbi:cell growth regulator with EF hand domain protein 1 isoform 1-T2 [Leptodactylus fuscus]|uniref:cell growth regulator with EF hand domain protein 1 n=1 Tax=Leptodactylus fuscus TaxID=238119 RepID=UPI003F4ED03D